MKIQSLGLSQITKACILQHTTSTQKMTFVFTQEVVSVATTATESEHITSTSDAVEVPSYHFFITNSNVFSFVAPHSIYNQKV